MLLDPHEAPPQVLKELFKSWRLNSTVLANQGLDSSNQELSLEIPLTRVRTALKKFYNFYHIQPQADYEDFELGKIYRSLKIPGLLIGTALLPPVVQKELLSRLLHRDLSNPEHRTNLHSHYDIFYPIEGRSFFSENTSSIKFLSKDRNINKNLDCRKALEKKLRWMTLGVQYDWTTKKYIKNKSPCFPMDLSCLLNDLFLNIKPQAAIVNLYSPGDTLSLHRDVSEEVNRGLVSISLGCDAYFIIGLHNKETNETVSEVLLLQSGDVLYMTEESRFAWHGVPIIIQNTCPDFLENWPGDEFPLWKEWIKKKRINLNVRQIWDDSKS